MREPGTPGFAGPLFITADQLPGPCYVLCPKRWRKGVRFILATLQPLIPTPAQAISFAPRQQIGTRQVVTFPRGRPLEWRLVDEPVYKEAPAWHIEARRLRAQKMSQRKIAKIVGKSKRAVELACLGE